MSEYYDEYSMVTTAREVRERLIQMFPFDAKSYRRSCKYVIHHSLKVLEVRIIKEESNTGREESEREEVVRELVICDPPKNVLHGAAVIWARARGAEQRRHDIEEGLVNVEFSDGPLGIHLEDRKGKYGASIHNFTRDEETKEMMAAEKSGMLMIGMVVLRVGEKEAVGEKFQDVLSMLREAPRPVEVQFGHEGSDVLLRADAHFGSRERREKIKKPTKTLQGTRVIHDVRYEFECVAKLNLESPLDTTLTIDSVSEYYDEHQLKITAREAQERLIQTYPFDADNYVNSTKYVIHHVMKVLDIDVTTNKLVLCGPPSVPKEAHSPVDERGEGRGETEGMTYNEEEEEGGEISMMDLVGEEDKEVLKEENVEGGGVGEA